MAMTAERKLKKAVINIMRNPLFADMSGILMLGTKSISDACPTAATNGRDEIYGRKFVGLLKDQELAFVVLHEGAHKLLRQLTVWRKLFEKNPKIANQAADYVVNLMLVKRDPKETVISMPKIDGKQIGCLDWRFDGMNTKQVFDILLKEQEEGGGKGPDGSGKQPGGGSGNDGQFDEHDWDGAGELTKQELDELEKEVDRAIRQGQITASKLQGKGGGTLDRELLDLMNPKVDWRELLKEFVSSMCKGRDFSSWRRPSRRALADDMMLPSMVSERVHHIVVGVDTSGSIGGAELTKFLSEVKAVAETVAPENLDLLYWDGRVASHEVYTAGTLDGLIASTKPKGGGGTDPACVANYLREKKIEPDCVLMLTDGYFGHPGVWDWPILWCVVNGSKKTIDVGKTVFVDD